MTVHLVRHAMPIVDPALPPGEWRLDAAGSAAAAALGPRLADVRRFASSPERKAVETITAVADGADVIVHPGFAEADRPRDLVPDYRARAAAYLAGEPMPGWEPAEAVVDRFTRAMNAVYDGAPTAIATHGLAMTLWMRATIGLDDPVSWWSGLAFPDVVTVTDIRRTP